MGDLDADDFSTVEGGSEYAGIHRLPDFKSMLEAALRGDVVRSCSWSPSSASGELSWSPIETTPCFSLYHIELARVFHSRHARSKGEASWQEKAYVHRH